MRVPMRRVDYNNQEDVIAFANELAKGGCPMTVCWNGSNYNIIHTENEDRLLGDRPVVYRTK